VDVDGERATFRVDLTALDPERVGVDEDIPYEAEFHGQPPWYPTSAPRMEIDGDGGPVPGQTGLAAWAESIVGFDGPEHAQKSLAAGRISYLGTIPPSAVALVEIPSPVVEAFAAHPDVIVHDDGEGAASGVLISHQDVEFRRAETIATTILDAGLIALGQSPSDPVASENRVAFHTIARNLERLTLEFARAQKFDDSDLAKMLGDLAAELGAVLPEAGWNRPACVTLVESAASCLPGIAAVAGFDAAQRVATAAIPHSRAPQRTRPAPDPRLMSGLSSRDTEGRD
jgi:hypothetical protein